MEKAKEQATGSTSSHRMTCFSKKNFTFFRKFFESFPKINNAYIFSTFCLNMRSLCNSKNFDNLKCVLESMNFYPTVLGITETWLKENSHHLCSTELPNYAFTACYLIALTTYFSLTQKFIPVEQDNQTICTFLYLKKALASSQFNWLALNYGTKYT